MRWAVILSLGAFFTAANSIPAIARENDPRLAEAALLYSVQDFSAAVPRVRALAGEREPMAETLLGTMYLHGEGVPRDVHQAVFWLRRAAAGNSRDAIMLLAEVSREGELGRPNLHDALFWYRRAAKLDVPEAFSAIAQIYLARLRGDFDLRSAHKWLRRGTAKLDGASFFTLGQTYLFGIGVTQDQLSAYVWFELATRTSVEPEYVKAKNDLREKLTPRQVGYATKAADAWTSLYDEAKRARSPSAIEQICPRHLIPDEVYLPLDRFCSKELEVQEAPLSSNSVRAILQH